jgi:hypothetical protein
MIGLFAAIVTLVVHVPLHLNSGAATPPPIAARYEHAFRALGPVVDHRGIGSWMTTGASAHLSFEADDHVFISTTPSRALAFLAAFLPRMRRELHQEAALGEVFDGWYGSRTERRRRVEVVLPLRCDCAARIRAIHLALAWAGGASQYDDQAGIHIYSSVQLDRANAILAAIRRLHESPMVTRSTFVLVE